jgi:hypothetical protein
MTVTKVVRYRTSPQDADENERLIRDVFAELAAGQPDGLRYASFRLDDGVSFIHVAVLDSDENPLSSSAAFATFQAGIKDRCADGPARPTRPWSDPTGCCRNGRQEVQLATIVEASAIRWSLVHGGPSVARGPWSTSPAR